MLEMMDLLFNCVMLLGMISLNNIWGKSSNDKKLTVQIGYGIALSVLLVLIMFHSWTAESGLIYDTRSVLLGVVGFFYAPLTILMTVVSGVTYRIYIGGIGTLAGVVTIIGSTLIGFVWRKYIFDKIKLPNFLNYLFLGYSLHLAMIVYHFFLPAPLSFIIERVKVISPIILTIFPLIVVAVAILIENNNKNISDQQLLKEREELYQLLLSNISLGIVHFDQDGVISECNQRFIDILGASRETLIGLNMTLLPNKTLAGQVKKALDGEEGIYAGQYKSVISGKELFTEAKFKPIYKEEVLIGGIAVITDLTKEHENEILIENLKNTDSLTGFRNQAVYYRDRKNKIYDNLHPLVLSIISFDNLQFIIDTMGYRFGEKAVVDLSDVLKKHLDKSDIIYRVSNTDFVVVSMNRDKSEVSTLLNEIEHDVKKIKGYPAKLVVTSATAKMNSKSSTWDETINYIRSLVQSRKAYSDSNVTKKTIDLLLASLFEKSTREKLHSERVGAIASKIALNLGNIVNHDKLRMSSRLHDIGKINIELSILDKVEDLTEIEYDRIKNHTAAGFRILSTVPEYHEVAEIVFSHHENYDGSGYPRGLKGDDIPIESRIISVADAFDAITNNRPYRKAQSIEYALSELKENSGTQFDPSVVEAFLKVYQK